MNSQSSFSWQGPYASSALAPSLLSHVDFAATAVESEGPLYSSSFRSAGGRTATAHSEYSEGSYQLHDSPMPLAPAELLHSAPIPVRTSSKKYRERGLMREPESNADQSVLGQSPMSTSPSRPDSELSCETYATSLPPLQTKGILDENDALQPLHEEDIDPASFDLIAPLKHGKPQYSLETRSELLFSTEHLKVIFNDPSLLLQFTAFLSAHKPDSIRVLIYYLNAVKALKAISYSNAIIDSLDCIPGHDFTATRTERTMNTALVEKARLAFDVMVRNDLPAYITHIYIRVVTLSIARRITGTLASHLRDASEGLAEVFCLTDPSRPDCPIVFASEEFHRTTQYGMGYVIGRNCRFLQGPKTNPFSVKRIREKIVAGKEHCEVFLNYRRDGSPFMNLLMVAPLCDSRGNVRYFIGAQVDVSGLVKECTDLESLKRLAGESAHENGAYVDQMTEAHKEGQKKGEFQALSEMLNVNELDIVRRWGGRMHKEYQEEAQENNGNGNWSKPRVLIHDLSPDGKQDPQSIISSSGKLSGVYENYLLVRPYPSLKILFSSPSLRLPGMLQSSFMARIGGNPRVREELTQALADGRGVTAKVRWVSKQDSEGRNRWIHCTPLIGSNGAIGVWMVVIVEDENSAPSRKFRQAPPVDPRLGRPMTARDYGSSTKKDSDSVESFEILGGVQGGIFGSTRSVRSGIADHRADSPIALRAE